MNLFAEMWKMQMHGIEPFEKAAKLSKSELIEIQNKIAEMQKKGIPSSKIITALQKTNGKLSERWKAERAYWTTVKRADTSLIGEAGEEMDITKYRVILSPNPCKECISKTRNGSKIFKTADIEKVGWGHVPPFHPNCYCLLIPQI
jgi:hypothetical protein